MYTKENDVIEKATIQHLDEIERLYDTLNDSLERGVNYSGWKKGLYPIRETALKGITEQTLFILKVEGDIAGTIILNHEVEAAYAGGKWGIKAEEEEIIVIHTFAIHPDYQGRGIGRRLLNFAEEYSRTQGVKVIRLDVSIHNTPAIKLYEKYGYTYRGTVDLGLGIPDLVWFRLYELIL